MAKFGVNLLLWADKFDRETVDLIPKVADMGFDGVEIPIFDPSTVDIPHTKAALNDTGLHPIACAIMGPDRDPINEDAAIRENGKKYLKACIEIIAELGGDTFIGPMYSAVGKLVGRGRNQQEWDWGVEVLGEVAEFAEQHGVTLAIEPLNRFETYFINIAEDAVKLAKEINNSHFKVHLEEATIDLEENDTIVLYTDGITEAKNENLEDFGEKYFTEILLENRNNIVDEISMKVIQEVTMFSHNHSQYDDITLVIFKWKPRQSEEEGRDRQKISAEGGSAYG